MSNNLIPELNEYQYNLLSNVSKSKLPAFMLTLPSENDSQERRKYLHEKRSEILYLMNAGFVTDASKDFAEMIRHNTETTGIVIKIYALTETAALMFKDCEERTVN